MRFIVTNTFVNVCGYVTSDLHISIEQNVKQTFRIFHLPCEVSSAPSLHPISAFFLVETGLSGMKLDCVAVIIGFSTR